jgi:hypothetical protein
MMNRREIGEVIKDEMIWKGRIRDLLTSEPMTVPAVAEALGQPADEVMLWMMGLRKYGWIAEGETPDAEGFYAYRWIGEGSR